MTPLSASEITTPPSKLGFVVLSDIHFGTLAEHADFAAPGTTLKGKKSGSGSMKKALLSAIAKYKGTIHYILAPGDLTSDAHPNDFIECHKILLEVAACVGLDHSRVIFTFGNHDTNWAIAKLATTPLELSAPSGYHYLAASAGHQVLNLYAPGSSGPIPGSGHIETNLLELIIINSGSFCIHEREYRHGRLGSLQFEWAKSLLEKQKSAIWRVVMLHHHPFNIPYPSLARDISTLEEGAEISQLLGAGNVDFVCHGHRHHPKIITRMEAGYSHPVTFFCAGSLAVNHEERADGEIPNCFHVAYLEDRHPGTSAASGAIHTFRYVSSSGWIPNDNCNETPLDAIQHFGSIATTPELKTQVASYLDGFSARVESGAIIALPSHVDLPPDLRAQRRSDLETLMRIDCDGRGWLLLKGQKDTTYLQRPPQ